MANFFQQLFGGGKKQVAADIKQAPLLSATAEYPLLKQTLEDRLAGRGLGYNQSVLDANTAPYAKSQREGFTNYTVPQISASASARGLGRSTIPVNQTRLGSQEVENSIAERVAQLTLENERTKSSEKQNAISGYGGLMTEDYNAMLNNINSQNAAAAEAARVSNLNAGVDNKMMQNVGVFALNAIGGTDSPITKAMNQISSPPSSAVKTDTSGSGSGGGGLFGNKNAASVNTGNINAEELAFIKSLLMLA